MTNRLRVAALGAAWALLVPGTPAQTQYDVKAHYLKREVYIPMRDGVKLFTIIYTPRQTTDRYPILMTRTAYGIAPYDPDEYRASLGPNNEFAKEGYIFVYHTFLKRHCVMVQIQSSWFPMFDRNPQTFVDIYHAKEADYRRAEYKVFRSAPRS